MGIRQKENELLYSDLFTFLQSIWKHVFIRLIKAKSVLQFKNLPGKILSLIDRSNASKLEFYIQVYQFNTLYDVFNSISIDSNLSQ